MYVFPGERFIFDNIILYTISGYETVLGADRFEFHCYVSLCLYVCSIKIIICIHTLR